MKLTLASILRMSDDEAFAAVSAFHVTFIMCSLCVLMIPLCSLSNGWKYFSVVVCYNTLLPYILSKFNDQQSIRMWMFSICTSFFMIIPDWWLSSFLEVLIFPEDGFFKIGSVAGYMAGLWAIPFFIILYYSSHLQQKKNIRRELSIGVIALLLFGSAEMVLQHLGSWYAVNVHMVAHTAIYIIPAEIVLSYAFSYAFQYVETKPMYAYRVVSIGVMLMYLLAATTSYYIFERILLA